MTESDIQCLKDNIDKLVEIETTFGERLIARVLFVTHSLEYDEHELTYDLVSTNMLESHKHLEEVGGYVLDFEKILSVRARAES